MSQIPYILSHDGTLTVYVNNKPHTVGSDHPSRAAIIEALQHDDADRIEQLVDIPTAVNTFMQGSVEVKDGQVYYQNAAVHNTVADRILQMMTENLPCDGMIKFLENLMQNPSKRSVDELYTFLENRNLPITSDGCFLAYKRVRDDWKDFFSGTVDNNIGKSPEMPRNQVDDNFSRDCSHGYHVGALDYVESFHANSGKVIIVKVNPKDVVSVPDYAGFTKMRVSKYTVVDEYTGPLTRPAYEAQTGSVNPVSPGHYQESYNPGQWDDDYYEDEEDVDQYEDEDDEDEEDLDMFGNPIR